MARVFVSYSRKNKDFCRRLTDELQQRELDFWVDWEGIPPTVDWMKEIEKGIEEADTFIAIVSPDWISSPICLEELGIAVKNGKRLIPVVPCDIVWNDVPAALAHLNFIFFTETFDFNKQIDTLFTALEADYDWLKTHRRLQVKALEWERAEKENGFLLRGKDLEEAEAQISINANKDPHPTDIQREYVLKSRQGSTRQRRITTGILIGLIAGMLGVITLLARPYVENAIAKAQAQNQSRMVAIPAGNINFQYGTDSFQMIELPAFNIEIHPVTTQAYDLCVSVDKCTPPIGSNASGGSSKGGDAVVWITITQATAYCEWLGRKLPSAPEWERAAGYLAQSKIEANRLSISDHLEWTTSYTVESSENTIGVWDGKTSSLNLIDWIFFQELGSYNSTNDLELQMNISGAFVAHDDLTFRCAG